MKQETIRRFAIVLKWIPRILIVAIVGFSFYVWWRYDIEEDTQPPEPSIKTHGPRTPGETAKNPKVQETSNIEYSHFDKGKLVYHVTADETETLKSNQQRLEMPVFIFYDENQKETIRVTGKHCNISKDFSQITVYEDTVVTSFNGMVVTAHQIKYNSETQEFSTPSQSHFEYGMLKGNSEGFIYYIPSQVLELLADPEVKYANKTAENRKPIVMTGKKGLIDRRTGFAYFDGEVEVTQGQDNINADRIEVQFEPNGSKLYKITGLQNVHVRFARPGVEDEAQTQTQPAAANPAAQPAVAQAADETPASQNGSRQPPGMANVFSTDASSGKDLDAELVELYFYEDGATIRSFHSEGQCTFVLHTFDSKGDPKENRIINGQTFDSTFDNLGQMQDFHANEEVSVKLQPFGNPRMQQQASRQTIFCDDLVATFVPETGEVKQIDFNDKFRHVQDARTVTSNKAVYYGDKRKTDLIGNPEIDDASYNITANNMELFEATSSIHASGDVKSQFIHSNDGKTPHTFPFASPSNQPVYISSEDMVWDSNNSEATYTVKSKLWQDKNVITGEKLVINDRDKTLGAYGKVHTIFYQKSQPTQTQPAQTQPAAPAKPASSSSTTTTAQKMFSDDETTSNTGPISVDAGVMNYAERDRIVHYEKTVKIVTTNTTIQGDKADFFLKEKNNEFDRLFAQGNVTINHLSKTGTGDQATFFGDDSRLVLEGKPKLSEPAQADILGNVLTLFLLDDRILIDGEEDGRATTTLAIKSSPIATTDSSDSSKKEKKKDDRDARSKDRKSD